MKQTLIALITAAVLLAACTKETIPTPVLQEEACEWQTDNPAGRSYSTDSLVAINCTSKHCGLLPLSTRNYWVYEDSIFENGILLKISLDTLRFSSTYESLPDGLVWWEGNLFVGLPEMLYASDSSVFEVSERLFNPGIKDAVKGYGLFAGDSIKYLSGFEDAAAVGRAIKLNQAYESAAGSFSGSIYFEKNARNYRRDQVYFQPGIGVLKYIQEKAPMGTFHIKLQQISTLIAYHLE